MPERKASKLLSRLPVYDITKPGTTLYNAEDALPGLQGLATWLTHTFATEDLGLSQPRLQEWIPELEKLKQEQLPRMIIALRGNSGAGKTSLLNAILDIPDFLPTSCVSACTSTVVEVSYHDKDTFEAKVIYQTRAEWKIELPHLLEDLFEEEGKLADFQTNEEGRIAAFKIQAVHPRATVAKLWECSRYETKLDELLEDYPIPDGQGTKFICHGSAKAFSKDVTRYVKGRDDINAVSALAFGNPEGRSQRWPLVKRIECHVKAAALATGVTLVDLPGCGDANSARAAVAKEYENKARGFLIVGEITRAVSDKVVQDLLGEAFQAQLKMDGALDDRRLALVCTKSEELVASEIIRDVPSAKKGFSPLNAQLEVKSKELKKLRDEVASLPSQIAKIKQQDAIAQDSSNKFKRSASQADAKLHVDPRLEALRAEEGGRADANSVTGSSFSSQPGRCESGIPTGDPDTSPVPQLSRKAARQIAFLKESQNRLSSKIANLAPLVEKMQKEVNVGCALARNKFCKAKCKQSFVSSFALPVNPQVPNTEHPDYSEVNLPVFCVSSRDYSRINRAGDSIVEPVLFSNEDETEIPQLQRHIKLMIKSHRDDFVSHLSEKLHHLARELEVYLSSEGRICSRDGDRIQQQVLPHRKTLSQGLYHIANEKRNQLKTQLHDTLSPKIQESAKSAEEKAVTTLASFSVGKRWNTYRAFMVRQGIFKDNDINELLIKPIIVESATTWGTVFHAGREELFSDFAKECMKQIEVAFASIDNSVDPSLRLQTQEIAKQQRSALSAGFRHLATKAAEQIQDIQKGISRQLTPDIQKKLTGSYKAAAQHRGNGCLNQMKVTMSTYVARNAPDVFSYSIKEADERLNNLATSFHGTLKAGITKLVRAFDLSYSVLWEDMRATSTQITLRRALRERTRELGEITANLGSRAKRSCDAHEEYM